MLFLQECSLTDDDSSSTKDDTLENVEIKEEKANSFKNVLEQYNQAWDNDGNLTVVW